MPINWSVLNEINLIIISFQFTFLFRKTMLWEKRKKWPGLYPIVVPKISAWNMPENCQNLSMLTSMEGTFRQLNLN